MTAARTIFWGIVIAKAAILALVILWLLAGAFKLSRLAIFCVLAGLGVHLLAKRFRHEVAGH
jgi:hypothetical protein